MSLLNYVPPACVVLMMAVSTVTYVFLPVMMVVHWNLALQPDGFAAKPVAALVLPILGLLLICMQLIGRHISGEGGGRIRFSKAVIFAMPILTIAHCAIIATALVSSLPGRG